MRIELKGGFLKDKNENDRSTQLCTNCSRSCRRDGLREFKVQSTLASGLRWWIKNPDSLAGYRKTIVCKIV